MNVPYEDSGRRAQKARTRAALAAATQRLFAQGLTPGVDQVADEAGISRTTAYRYFPNQRSLLAVAFPETAADSLLSEPAPKRVSDRLDQSVERLARFNLRWEPQLRAQLRASLEPDSDQPPLRRGRAITWLEEALAPLRTNHPTVDVHRLAVAIRAATGIESLVWLTDVAGLDRHAYVELARWTARALLDAAVKDGRQAKPPAHR
ncbi:MAG TPA: TetR family transcriptional regulator [Jatrophihabitans sp.]|nr:TetR family transcriptional regulator [Jatrophihabitans sp.]